MANVKQSAIGIRQEATPGTPVVPQATDFLWVENLKVEQVQTMINPDYARSFSDSLPSIPGPRTVKVSFKTPIKGGVLSSATANFNAYGALSAALEACGLTGGYHGANVDFDWASTTGRPATIVVYQGGLVNNQTRKQIIPFCVVTSLKQDPAEPGKIGFLDFAFEGIYTEPTDSALPAITPNAVKEPIVFAAGLQVQGFTPVGVKWDWDLGIKTAKIDDVNSSNGSSGVGGFYICSSDAKGNVEMFAPTIAAKNLYNIMSQGTTGSLSAQVGTVPGNIVKFSFPCAQITSVKDAAQNDFLVYQLPLDFSSVTGGDAGRISFQ